MNSCGYTRKVQRTCLMGILSFIMNIARFVWRKRAEDVEELQVHLTTWNVNSKKPLGNLEPLLGVDGGNRPDLIAISFQEVTMKPHKAIFSLLTDYDSWSYIIEGVLISKGYFKVGTVRLVGILMNVYALHDHRAAVSKIETNFFRTGFGGLYGSKGAVYIHFDVYGSGICLVNSHLPAHDEELKGRIRDFNLIDEHRKLACKPETDRYTFWMGDLNFRLEDPTITAERISNIINRGETNALLARDQLLNNMAKGYIFNGFTEPHISFNPTFKFVVGTEEYNMKRRPAWTDRILYSIKDTKDLQVEEYTSMPRYDSSDHKPVVATYIIKVDKNHQEPNEDHEEPADEI